MLLSFSSLQIGSPYLLLKTIYGLLHLAETTMWMQCLGIFVSLGGSLTAYGSSCPPLTFHLPSAASLDGVIAHVQTLPSLLRSSRKKGISVMLCGTISIVTCSAYSFQNNPFRLAEIAHSLLKLAPYDTQTMESRGLRRYIMEMLPITDWAAEAVRPALILILKRLDRMFNKIHKMPTLR